MAPKKTLAISAVVMVVVAYYVNIPVPPTFSASESWKLRVLGFGLDLNAVLRSFPTNAHVHLTNFVQNGANLFSKADDPSIKFTDMRIDDGVKIRLYEPVERKKTRAGLVYIHGGGFVYGNTDTHHVLTHHLAAELDIALVSVDYRLSWQAIFPNVIDDCTTATIWFIRHAKDYNVDPNRIAVAGDSSGGNAAAAVAGRLTFKSVYANLPKLKFQGLFYSPFQAFDFQTPSYQQYGEMSSIGVTKELLAYCYITGTLGKSQYTSENREKMFANNHTSPEAKEEVANLFSHDMIPVKFKEIGYKPPTHEKYGHRRDYEKIKSVLHNLDGAPLMRKSLQGLPPAYIVTAQYDPLRDDGIMYVRRLEHAGVKVTWKHYENGVHGMFSFFTGPLSLQCGEQSVKDFIDYAKQSL